MDIENKFQDLKNIFLLKIWYFNSDRKKFDA